MRTRNLEPLKKWLGYGGHRVDEEKALELLARLPVQAHNTSGDTPLTIAAMLDQPAVLGWLLARGAEVDYRAPVPGADSALLWACYLRRLACIRPLVEAGADLEQTDSRGLTPLARVFTNTATDPLPAAAYLLSQGARLTKRVEEIATGWNAARFAGFRQLVADAGPGKLVTQLPPVVPPPAPPPPPPAPWLDLAALPAPATEADYAALARLVWRELVPRRGPAATVQGELLRALEKLRDEAQRNGNGNFHPHCHGLLLAFLRTHLADGTLPADQTRQVQADLRQLGHPRRPYLADDVYDRLTRVLLDWCLRHPHPLPHVADSRLYC